MESQNRKRGTEGERERERVSLSVCAITDLDPKGRQDEEGHKKFFHDHHNDVEPSLSHPRIALRGLT